MLKINPLASKSVSRYFLKSTVNARYNRNMDLSALMSVGLCTQIFRLPSWQMEDIPITTMIVCTALKSLYESAKNRMLLMPIIKRAKAIKKASKT